MELLRSDNSIFIPDFSNYINEGSYGRVYRLNELECLKVFKRLSITDPESVIKFFSEHDFNNFYKIIELYYNNHPNPRYRYFSAYRMRYYETSKIDLFDIDISYIIESYLGLLKDIELLSQNNVILSDFKWYNMLLTKDKIICIDVDKFNKNYKNDPILALEYNKYLLRVGLIELIVNSYINSESVDKQKITQRILSDKLRSISDLKILRKERNLNSYLGR